MRNYTDEDIKEAVKESTNLAVALEKIGLRAAGGNYRTLHSHIKRLNLNIDHFIIKRGHKKHIPLNEILVKNSTYKNRACLKKRLIEEKLLIYKCNNCEIKNWDNKPLTLQMDHINGIYNDNRIKNIQLLCPNCHSQTETFAGRNQSHKGGIAKYYKDPKYTGFCKDCKQKLSSRSIRCMNCSNKKQQKIKWPSVNKLIEMLSESNFYALGKKLGVSDNAIRKYLERRGINPKTLK